MTANQTRTKPAGFTLVELLVTLVIVAILASLTLAGLGTVRRRAKEDSTLTTIRKIHEVIMPIYEGYLDRRLSTSFSGSVAKLVAHRRRLAFEMPDNWSDVPPPSPSMAEFENGRTKAYDAYEGGNLAVGPNAAYTDSAECLYMICVRSGYDPEAMEHFRGSEIGDVDEDGKPEFHDAWGAPIAFIRWPTGYEGTITLNQAVDPFDPDRVDTSLGTPPADPFKYGVEPLIFSAGLDGEYGVVLGNAIGTKSDSDIASLDAATTNDGAHFAAALAGDASLDNITNHDLVTR